MIRRFFSSTALSFAVPALACLTLGLVWGRELGWMLLLLVLVLTMMISAMTLAGERSTLLQGAVNLVLFAAFLFLVVMP